MAFTKITEADMMNKGVVGLPDTPNLSTSEMQQKFDEIATDVIVPKFNNLVDELDASNIDKRIESETITNMRLNEDNNIEVSLDGGTSYKQTASSGHIVMDGTGRSFPQRSRLQYSANTIISDIPEDNTTFIQVPSGVKGDKGDSATITIGNVESANVPYVKNVGSQYDAIFDFGIPKGSDGNSATVQVGTVTSGATASVSNRGTSSNAIFDFVLPKGDKGDNGTSFQVLGTFATYSDLIAKHPVGNRGDAYAVGDSTSNVVYNWNNDTQTWDNLGALKGAKGDNGKAATVTVGTVSEGATPSVENVGTSENAILNFTLQKGEKGDVGNAATIAIGTVERGEVASVVNSGTTTNAVFDFVIPKGDKGDTGDPSIVNGKTGESIVLYGYDLYLKNYNKASEYTEITDDDNIQSAIAKLDSKNSGGSIIRVNLSEDEKGDTITFTLKDTPIQTKVVPLTEPYMVEFSAIELGTATITNTTKEVSKELVIENYSLYEIAFGGKLHNYQDWLESASISDTYGSLENVLADEKALRILMTKHASVDYLVEWIEGDNEIGNTILDNDYCAKWINLRDYALDTLYSSETCKAIMDFVDKYGYGEWVEKDGIWQPKGCVPIMTSNTAPYGKVSANSQYSGYAPWHCFDGSNQYTGEANIWAAENGVMSGWIIYEFVNPICVKKLKLINATTSLSQAIKDFKLQGSNDGITYKDILTDTNAQGLGNIQYFNAENNDEYYKYIKLDIINTYGANINLAKLQFYGRSLNVSVPIMESNTEPWGEAVASDYYGSGYEAYKAFDGNDDTRWASIDAAKYAHIYYKFPNKVNVKLAFVNPVYKDRKYIVRGSNDGSNWDNISEEFITPTANKLMVIPINTDKDYQYWDLYNNEVLTGSNSSNINTLQFYGLDYSEHEERHYIYDHGIEFDEIAIQGTVNKNTNDIVMTANGTTTAPSGIIIPISGKNNKIVRFSIGNVMTGTFRTIIDDSLNIPWNSGEWIAFESFALGSSYLPNNGHQEMVNGDYNGLLIGDTDNTKVSITEWWLE